MDNEHLHPRDGLIRGLVLSFCILRVLTGIGLGVLMPLAITYINELAPRRVVNVFAFGVLLWGGRSAELLLGWSAYS